MMLWYCKSCTAAYAPAAKCPQCGSADHDDQQPGVDLIGGREPAGATEPAQDAEPGAESAPKRRRS